MLIYHLARTADWTAADLGGVGYAPPAFADEGFVHCSTLPQLLPSAQRHLADEPALVAVALESDRLGRDLVWERAP